MIRRAHPFKRGLLATAALASLCPSWVHAVELDWGPGLKVNLDTSLSLALAARTKRPNCAFLSPDNGGCPRQDGVDPINADDGDANYSRGSLTSGAVRGVHDLFVKAPDGWSGLLRGNWYADLAATRTDHAPLNDESYTATRRGAQLLDAYIDKQLDLGDRSMRVRVGNQVMSWGEDIYIQGGINSINSIDVRRSHSPGVQLKELFLPAPMLSLNAELARGLSVEGYYQWAWNSYKFDPVGTFFSTSDVVGPGRNGAYLGTVTANQFAAGAGLPAFPYGTIGDSTTRIIGADPTTGLPYNRRLTPGELGSAATNPLGGVFGTGNYISQGADNKPGNSGQFGLAARYTLPESGDEVGIYFVRYHDKLPFASYRVDQATATNPLAYGGIFLDYARNRNLFGASLNTRVGDWAVGFEGSYRPRESVPIDPTIVTNSASPYYCNADGNPANYRPTGDICRGAIDLKKYQFHVTGLNILAPTGSMGWLLRGLGASEGTFTGELAIAHYPDLQIEAGIPYGAASSVSVPYSVAPNYRLPTRTSSGAVASIGLTYPNAFGLRASLLPDLTVAYGTSGVSASALPGFIKGAGSVVTGLTIDFKTRPFAKMRVDFTHYFGAGLANPNLDRDYVTASLTTSF